MIPISLVRGCVARATGPIALGQTGVPDPSAEFNIAVSQETLGPATTPPATLVFELEIQLVAGVATLDLTAVPQGNLPNADMSATSVLIEGWQFVADPANTDRVVVSVGATNGYNFAGEADSKFSLGPNERMTGEFVSTLDPVAAADAEIDFASADLDAKIKVLIYGGI